MPESKEKPTISFMTLSCAELAAYSMISLINVTRWTATEPEGLRTKSSYLLDYGLLRVYC